MSQDIKEREETRADAHQNDGAISSQAAADREIAELESLYAAPAHEQEQSTKKSSFTQKFKGVLKASKSKSPIIAIVTALLGGGGIIASIFGPIVPLLSLADTFERDLNTQLSAMERTSDQLWRAKLRNTTSGSCGRVNVPVLPCRYTSVNVDKFEKAVTRANTGTRSHVAITYNRDAGWGPGRGKIDTIVFTSESGEKHVIDTPRKRDQLIRTDPEFRTMMYKVYNPRFSAFKTQTALSFLKKAKTNYSKKLVGTTEDEVRESKSRAIKSAGAVNFTQPRAIVDEEGNETGRFEDPETGRELTPQEVEAAKTQEERVRSAPSTNTVLHNLARGAMVTGTIDTACSVYNMSRAVSAGAKIIRSQELIRYSMVYINEAHAIRAELSTPETVKVASDDIMYMEPATQIADESKLKSTPAGQALPMIDNPDAGKTGMDAAFYRMSSSQDYPKKLDAQTQSIMPGGGFSGTLASVNAAIAGALGADNPKTISERCQIVQNPFVRTGALVIGVAAAVGTFGTSTAISLSGSVALAFAMPYLAAQLADMAAGNATEDLKGMGSVNAIATGSSLTFNGMARENGLMTMDPESMADYQNSKREVLTRYDEIDKIAAAKNPFDITNQFSFAGSLARTSLPIATQIKSGGMSTIASIPMIASQAAQLLIPATNAADEHRTLVRPERYTMCNDPDYQSLGPNVAVDPTCVMVMGLPKEAMNIDPIENVEWMLANDEIVPSSDSGEPQDNGRDWNYMKYLEQCVTQQPGATEDPEANPTNGGGCTSEENYERNWHYAKFKLTHEVQLGMDQELPGLEAEATTSIDNGSRGTVGLDGWAYPADEAATQVSSGFGMRGGSMHQGTDIAGPLDTPIYAARDGKVIAAGPASGFGNWIVLQHDVDGQRVDTVYGHMASSGVLVKRGDDVKAGDLIAKIGNEGFSTGPHLHFEVWQGGRSDVSGGGGRAIDPQPILDKAKRTESGGVE